jgi:hypothetical protein
VLLSGSNSAVKSVEQNKHRNTSIIVSNPTVKGDTEITQQKLAKSQTHLVEHLHEYICHNNVVSVLHTNGPGMEDYTVGIDKADGEGVCKGREGGEVTRYS